MRRGALSLLVLAACAAAPDAREHLGASRGPFTSADAVLLDFELDGKLVADTDDPATVRTQIQAQLMFTVGQLNGASSVGRFERLELSDINATSFVVPPPPAPPAPPPPPDDAGAPDGGDAEAGVPSDAGTIPDAGPPPAPVVRYAVSYHAKLPVAWGAQVQPSTYALTLPASVTDADQASFAAKYGVTCVDPEAGTVTPGTMFLFFRPNRAGCQFASGDVVTASATVTRSQDNAVGKYPEYQRVWADAALEVVALFSHEYPTPDATDQGVHAYSAFVVAARDYLRELQPDDQKRIEQADEASTTTTAPAQARLDAELPDGRRIDIAVRLVGYELALDGAAFDAWYDAVTPAADIILYNGHAGLGENVVTLMGKGTFRPGQYLIWFADGCDTFAYVDRTLANRRAPLNPDDPSGTKYMDTVTNVMQSYFGSLTRTSMTFIRALTEARDSAPRTYAEILTDIDPAQVTVVTGEEDNVLGPIPPPPPRPGGPAPRGAATAAPASSAAASAPQQAPAAPSGGGHGCVAAPGEGGAGADLPAIGLLLLAVFVRRRAAR